MGRSVKRKAAPMLMEYITTGEYSRCKAFRTLLVIGLIRGRHSWPRSWKVLWKIVLYGSS